MRYGWTAVLVVVLFACGCSAVNSKPPIRLELPTMQRHFIVMAGSVLV